jgi:hypothetical protein
MEVTEGSNRPEMPSGIAVVDSASLVAQAPRRAVVNLPPRAEPAEDADDPAHRVVTPADVVKVTPEMEVRRGAGGSAASARA